MHVISVSLTRCSVNGDHPIFVFNDTPPTEIYTLSLHDALPIGTAGYGAEPASYSASARVRAGSAEPSSSTYAEPWSRLASGRSEEHTSELQSRQYLVCRLLLEKKNQYALALLSE